MIWITIVVQQNSDASTVSVADSKKQQTFDAALQQFLALNAFGNGIQQIGKVASANKLPEISFNYNSDTKANADQQRTDTFARMTAEIADVKPNGTLVLEATAHVRMDKEDQIFRLTGVCRAEDVAADNTIVSSQIAQLDLSKDTAGDVKNGTKRGWLNSIIDTIDRFKNSPHGHPARPLQHKHRNPMKNFKRKLVAPLLALGVLKSSARRTHC